MTCRSCKAHCLDWADDHTHLQKLCLKAGFSFKEVEGDNYSVPSIMDLADMLFSKIDNASEHRQGTQSDDPDGCQECSQ